ncbi:PREDICTED: U1 small nuclear ribonucleoprotein 70 kDa-like isoform X3 [Populus euphratica]|uniref:U1 small nuclear ribonucleoprotein 70 kDa-like isoform X3 n=1 Tax=Populus euphratica TaxID=75702 RepID=A0AAJ6SW92_POPEU|nr:PREDICTED: U1 small nuclear ribonucleoprotein 70 kDa-like isoform X3 [Populus euphratica]
MSGAPVKRSHEEGGHSSSLKFSPHEDTGSYLMLTSGVSNEYHLPYEMGPDARVAKIPRTESQDVDRRSPLHSMYRIPPSSNESHMDSHLNVAPERRPESRDSKDSRDYRIENRDPRTDAREMYGEVKRDSQSVKHEKDVRFESRGDGNKEAKHDKEAHIEPKNDIKIEKDGFGPASSQVNWKEPKEYHRGKRCLEFAGVHVDPWHISHFNSQGPAEIEKEVVSIEERDHAKVHKAVGENKVELKGEDRFKDKDRKRKDLKLQEWGDRDKERSDRRGNKQVGNSIAEGKESVKVEREGERWEWERKDLSKDRERLKEREKDHMKRESGTGAEKEGLHSEKESVDGSVRISEQENPALEPKKQKDFDNRKNVDKEAKDKKKEREADIEVDRPEKGSTMCRKESDDGCADGEIATERERGVFNYGVQQRKRMLWPRGSPQVANCEPCFRSHTQDCEGCQGKSEVPSVIYKVSECMQELIKLWMEYEASQSDKHGENNHKGPTLEIRIPAEHITATNRQVRGGQLWGTDIYTNDSDLVAVLMHTGYFRPTASPPPPAIQELCATVRVLPPQDSYISMLRNNVRSRAWGAGIGCSYHVERCCIVKKGGGTIYLEPCLTHTSAVEPTLAPVAVERTMTTRAAASLFSFRMHCGNRDLYVKLQYSTTFAMSRG